MIHMIYFIIIILLFLFSLYQIKKILKDIIFPRNLKDIIKDFPAYTTVLHYHLEKAYEIIYRENILIYSIEATKMPDKEFNQISKEFGRLVMDLMGPNLTMEMIRLYGDEETLLFNIIEFFNSKSEDDEVRKNAQEKLMYNDEEDEKDKK